MWKHGTLTGYANRKCRCDECRAAARAYYAERRKRCRPETTPHGTLSGYNNHFCRCDACREVACEYQREKNYREKYGISGEDYDRLLLDQDGRCRICRSASRRGRRLMVDHDHRTSEVRGLLCFSCNIAIGYFADDPARLRAAADYLEGCRVG